MNDNKCVDINFIDEKLKEIKCVSDDGNISEELEYSSDLAFCLFDYLMV